MNINVGLSPKSMGLIYLANTHNIIKPPRLSERWGVAEQTTGNVYDSIFMKDSISYRQFFTVPLKYQGGMLVMGATPEVGVSDTASVSASITSLKDFIEYGNTWYKPEDKIYDGYVPDEVDWFYVKDIEVYIKGTDTTPLANDAIINVRNHVAVTQRYVSGITSPQTYGFKMTGTIDSNDVRGMYYNRDEQALPLQTGAKDVHLSTDIRNMTHPNKLYSNYQHISSASSEDQKGPSIIMGLLDESHPKDYDSRISRQVSAYNYPDRANSARTIKGAYYTGNKPITFSVLGPYGNSTYFSSPKLDTLRPSTLTSNMTDVNTSNVNTILEESTGDNYYSAHGVNRFYYGGPFASALPIRTPIVMSLPTINTPLSIYNNAYPKLSTVTPVNLGKQFEDVDLGLYQFMIDNSAYSQLMNLVGSLLNESLDPTNAVPGQFVTKLVLTGTDIVMMMIGKQAMLSDLNNSFNNTLRVADVTTLGILSDVVETWNLHLPQTQTIEIGDEFKKNRGNPFIKVPINRLFKSVREFYDYVDSLNITSFQNVNVTPYIDSEYNQVWEKWGKQLFKRGRSEYRNSSLASFKRPNDTNIDYK